MVAPPECCFDQATKSATLRGWMSGLITTTKGPSATIATYSRASTGSTFSVSKTCGAVTIWEPEETSSV